MAPKDFQGVCLDDLMVLEQLRSLLPDVLQDVMSTQLLQKFLQVFFCSDEVWNINKSGVVLAGMVVT
jgi:hypothetical protein